MAYEMIKRLKCTGKEELLNTLTKGVSESERKKGKKHQVFRLSFDARKCYDTKMIEQKLDYLHHNPMSGKWRLGNNHLDYIHSSAGFYEKGIKGLYEVIHYKDIGESLIESESSGERL